MKRVVIVGAGFAGLSAMEALQGKGYSITLIDRHNFATFQPLLYQVATAGLNPGDVAFPVRTLLRHRQNVKFRQGILEKIDTDTQRVMLADGEVRSVHFDPPRPWRPRIVPPTSRPQA